MLKPFSIARKSRLIFSVRSNLPTAKRVALCVLPQAKINGLSPLVSFTSMTKPSGFSIASNRRLMRVSKCGSLSKEQTMICRRLPSNLVDVGRKILLRRLISLPSISAAFRSATEALSGSQTIAFLRSTNRSHSTTEPTLTCCHPIQKGFKQTKSLKQGMPLLVMLSHISLKRFRKGLI